ncbi:MAG: tyrosine-type recombinase/integrase [Anaerolineae bacterium]|nr:tyrosine-type recombinase/integrase [Anaerolineae bacterium]
MLLTVREAAERLRVSARTVEREIAAGRLACVRVRSRRLVDEAARKAAGMADVHFHDLRHTYASWLAQDGVSMASIRDLLGHASMQTTSRYAHLGRADLIEATRRVGDRVGSGGNGRKAG